jgi:hypothetical protein
MISIEGDSTVIDHERVAITVAAELIDATPFLWCRVFVRCVDLQSTLHSARPSSE